MSEYHYDSVLSKSPGAVKHNSLFGPEWALIQDLNCMNTLVTVTMEAAATVTLTP